MGCNTRSYWRALIYEFYWFLPTDVAFISDNKFRPETAVFFTFRLAEPRGKLLANWFCTRHHVESATSDFCVRSSSSSFNSSVFGWLGPRNVSCSSHQDIQMQMSRLKVAASVGVRWPPAPKFQPNKNRFKCVSRYRNLLLLTYVLYSQISVFQVKRRRLVLFLWNMNNVTQSRNNCCCVDRV